MRTYFFRYSLHLLFEKMLFASFYLRARDSIRHYVGRSVGPSVCRSVSPSVSQSVGLSVRRSVGPSVRQSVGPSVRRSVGPSVGHAFRNSSQRVI